MRAAAGRLVEKKVIGSPGCLNWCTAMLWIIPAKVQGTWTTPQGLLRIRQSFQKITGTLGVVPITGSVMADRITFIAASTEFAGRVDGRVIRGSNWDATRIE